MPSSTPAITIPVSSGQSSHRPRGDYTPAAADYTCHQHWDAYTPEQHALYRQLVQRQMKLNPGRACEPFIAALHAADAAQHIPDYARVSEQLQHATGWQLAAVPGIIPEAAFFSLLAARIFPVTYWIRSPEEFEYIVEPDLFHDFFGHVPLLFNPVFADTMQAFGRGGMHAVALGCTRYWARLYWRTIEFGLIHTADGLRAYGAGILSSPGELLYSLQAPKPQRIAFDLERVLRSQYRIDTFQDCYFVIDSFEQLFDVMTTDFAPLYAQLASLPEYAPDTLLPGERTYPPLPEQSAE